MICPYCIDGYIYEKIKVEEEIIVGPVQKIISEYDVLVPCGECGGSGILHCCEGLISNEEKE